MHHNPCFNFSIYLYFIIIHLIIKEAKQIKTTFFYVSTYVFLRKLSSYFYICIYKSRKKVLSLYIYIYIYTKIRQTKVVFFFKIFTAQHIHTLGLQIDQKIMVNFMRLTTLMPSSGQNIWFFELKLKILDEAEKRFLSKNIAFIKKMW